MYTAALKLEKIPQFRLGKKKGKKKDENKQEPKRAVFLKVTL